MKLALGTAQFGLDYGISNTAGVVRENEVARILDYCREHAIDTLDTAQAYGTAENVLGRFDLSAFRVITKITRDGSVEKSLDSLNLPHVYGVLLHREDELDDATWARLESAKRNRLVSRIGVSVYSPETLARLIESYPIDIVQLPLNILDQRFVPLLPLLKRKGIEVHVRSVFLQGLLLMEPVSVPPFFNEIRPLLETIPIPRLRTTLAFAKQITDIDRIVVGVTSLQELTEVCQQYDDGNGTRIDFSQFAIDDEKFINPSKWRTN